jgi:phage gpG-like protein
MRRVKNRVDSNMTGTGQVLLKDFPDTVSENIRQIQQSKFRAPSPTQVAFAGPIALAQSLGTTGSALVKGGREVGRLVQEYDDPANLLGDLITLALTHEIGGGVEEAGAEAGAEAAGKPKSVRGARVERLRAKAESLERGGGELPKAMTGILDSVRALHPDLADRIEGMVSGLHHGDWELFLPDQLQAARNLWERATGRLPKGKTGPLTLGFGAAKGELDPKIEQFLKMVGEAGPALEAAMQTPLWQSTSGAVPGAMYGGVGTAPAVTTVPNRRSQ